jgi:type IV pilus assembly protein PilY1
VSGFPVYTVSYAPSNWTGDVAGFVATAKAPGDVTPVTGSSTWSAQAKLDALVHAVDSSGARHGWDTGRRIITSNGRGSVAFRYGSLGSSQQSLLSNDQVNYLRGDQSNEGTAFRVRQHMLGDIVHSEAVLVQDALSPKYNDASNPGYSAFAQTAANRAPVVYVGANDGCCMPLPPTSPQPPRPIRSPAAAANRSPMCRACSTRGLAATRRWMAWQR